MDKYKYLILGAGPAGLALANILKRKGENSFLVIEKESCAGGLCRAENVDGAPLDIGGGHFLDANSKASVLEFLFGFMPKEEWNLFNRDAQIHYKDYYIQHPFEANIWQMNMDDQVEFLESIAQAGCVKGIEEPSAFVPWIEWKLGKKIAEEYMLPYNRKMFAEDLNELGTYWLVKLPEVSFRDTLKSCLSHKAYAKLPCVAQFYYPQKYGYGELWIRMAQNIKSNIVYNSTVSSIDVKELAISCKNGLSFSAEKIITTIPWKSFELLNIEREAKNIVGTLKHTSVDIAYFAENLKTTAHWIYEPDPAISYHRILVRSNFYNNAKGYWTETNSERMSNGGKSLFHYLNEYAYPLNTIGKQENMQKLLEIMRIHNIYGLGRWGEHRHFNSDVVVARAMDIAERI